MQQADITAITRELAGLVAERYVFPGLGSDLSQLLEDRLADGRYTLVPDEESLAATLTQELQSLNGDKHLRLRHSPGELPERGDEAAELAAMLLAESAAYEQHAPANSLTSFRPGASAVDSAAATPQSAFENIALAHREIYALYEIAQPMSTSLSAADTMALISSKLAKIVPWSGCSLFLRDSKSHTLKCAFAVGLDVPRLLNRTLSGEYSLDGWMARTRRPLVNSDPRIMFESAGLDGRTELKSALVCPLVFNDTLIGVLAVYHVDADRYTEGHRRLLERVAEQAGVVLHNSLVFEKTQEEALTDALTGLPNRRSIMLHLSQELSRAERLRSRVALILLDIDEFKSINDTHGHNIGDRALCEVATALQSVLRSYDLCARYGGDEFVLVLPELHARGRRSQAPRVAAAHQPDPARDLARDDRDAGRQRRRRRCSPTTAPATKR